MRTAMGYVAGGLVFAIMFAFGFALVREVRAAQVQDDPCAEKIRTASIAGTAMQLCLQDESCAPTFADYRDAVTVQLIARECVGNDPFGRPLE